MKKDVDLGFATNAIPMRVQPQRSLSKKHTIPYIRSTMLESSPTLCLRKIRT